MSIHGCELCHLVLTHLLYVVTNRCDYKFNEVKDALNRGAEVNKADDNGNSPLHLATMTNSHKTAQLLIDRGAERKSHYYLYYHLY